MIRNFCTLFDRNYFYKGVVMLRSLTRHSPSAKTYVVCLDDITRNLLDKLTIPGVETIALSDVESDEVLNVKPTRSVAEYCWTLTSVAMWHVMQVKPEIDLLTYLDADLMFFSSVEPIFAEMGMGSILAIEHRYGPESRHLEMYGKFNVQWVSFRRDENGLKCLASWRAQCLEWCFARIEDGKHGDQKYLDAWPADYGASFHSLRHVGAGLAPWNYLNHSINLVEKQFTVDDQKLIFYHFHQFEILAGGGFNCFRTQYFHKADPPKELYESYWAELQEAMKLVHQLDPTFQFGTKTKSMIKLRYTASRMLPTKLKNALKRIGIRA